MLLCHDLARAYGGTPSDWRERAIESLSFDVACLRLAQRRTEQRVSMYPPKSVQPVLIVAGG